LSSNFADAVRTRINFLIGSALSRFSLHLYRHEWRLSPQGVVHAVENWMMVGFIPFTPLFVPKCKTNRQIPVYSTSGFVMNPEPYNQNDQETATANMRGIILTPLRQQTKTTNNGTPRTYGAMEREA